MSWLSTFANDQRGATPALEFALVLPIVLVLVGLVTQVALLLVGQIVVEYAAYAAARSAIVWIPADLPNEPPNRLLAEGSEKIPHVQAAAAAACAAITPSWVLGETHGGAPAAPVQLGLESVPPRLLTARHLTRVELPSRLYRPHSAVTVVVEHDFILRVPGIARLLGEARGIPSVRTRRLRAQATLLNQGGPRRVRRA